MSRSENVTIEESLRDDCIRMLAERGMFIEIGYDFTEYAHIVREERPLQPLAPPFDPEKQFIPPQRGFYITGRNDDGRLVHNQAMRVIDLRSMPLSTYMQRRFTEFLPTGVTIKKDSMWYRPGPGAQKITGPTAYHGDLWVDPDGGKFRGGGFVDILARLAFLVCLDHFDVAYVYGLMIRTIARRGLAEREGYMHVDPYCMGWETEEHGKPFVTNMVYMANDDLRHLIEVPFDFVA
jgi:hypothetical protein